MKKRLLLAISIFLTLGGFAMASSRLPDGSIPDERLMEKLKTAARVMGAYYGTQDNIERQNNARSFIVKVLNNRRFSGYVPLAFNEAIEELESEHKVAVLNKNRERAISIEFGITKLNNVRTDFGL